MYRVSQAPQIIPAIMPSTFEELENMVSRVRGLVPEVQIDIMDGSFVPSQSWPYTVSGGLDVELTRLKQTGLPLWDEMYFEVDLMVARPKEYITKWIDVGAQRIIVHIESTDVPREIITLIDAYKKEEREYEGMPPLEIGFALSIDTPLDALSSYIHRIDVVQLMGIERIGYQGEPFDERVIKRVHHLREEYPHLIISVDGGVSKVTAPQLISAGADRLVSGSAIFESGNIQEALQQLRQV